MKKPLIVLIYTLTLTFIIGCNQASIVSDNTVKKALDIAHEQSNDPQKCFSEACALAYIYLHTPTWNKHMDCRVLDNSDVHGKKTVKGCFVQDSTDSVYSGNKNVLILSQYLPSNKDIVLLMFYQGAEKTDAGFSWPPLEPAIIAVNLKTRKIGNL